VSKITTATNTATIRRDRGDGDIGPTSKDQHLAAEMSVVILSGSP